MHGLIRTIKVQRRLKRIERDYKWLIKEGSAPDAAKTFGFPQEVLNKLVSGLLMCLEGAQKLHAGIFAAAENSTDSNISEFARGPGRKGDD